MISNSGAAFPLLINCCPSIWVAHVPFLKQHLEPAFQEFHPNLLFEMFYIKKENKLQANPPTPTPTPALTFTELASFTFLLIFPKGGLRHISNRSLCVYFGPPSTSGQHLTSEQMRIHDPDNAEPNVELGVGSERVHTSKNYKLVSKRRRWKESELK